MDAFLGKFFSSVRSEAGKRPLSLVELLGEGQPYKELHRLQDAELSPLDPNDAMLAKIQGSLIGLAVGDALGASVEFRPHSYMLQNQVTDMQGGGTWGLKVGQWTDDTSMALCLAASLIVKGEFDGYDQLKRYREWFRNGYMSATGKCFDIGGATRAAITEFEKRQQHSVQSGQTDEERSAEGNFDIQCGDSAAAGNGPLMRLAPIPLFYHRSKETAIEKAASSASLTHGDQRALDTCRFYAALIWHAIRGESKDKLLDPKLYCGSFKSPLHPDVVKIMEGSYKNKKNGYEDGIRGHGFVLDALEAALWAFYHDEDSFEKGVLKAVNLGDDTDTTAAIYGQLAGAVYGRQGIPEKWLNQLFQKEFIVTVANGLYVKGKNYNHRRRKSEAVDDDEGDRPRSKRTTASDKDPPEDRAGNEISEL